MKYQFKVGDRVSVTHLMRRGRTGKIVQIRRLARNLYLSRTYSVMCDEPGVMGGSLILVPSASHMKLIESAKV